MPKTTKKIATVAKKVASKKKVKKIIKRKIVKKPKKLVKKTKKPLPLKKAIENPIISPRQENSWESIQTFNPAAMFADDKVHLLYRALGDDGISRIGYATSEDGINIDERLDEPIFVYETESLERKSGSTGTLKVFRAPEWMDNYNSGGGWGGCEDPRVTKIDDKVYMFFVAYDAVNPPAIAFTSISFQDFLKRKWKWGGVKVISKPGIIDKSGCVFPEKINGKYVIMHRIFPNILIDYVDNLDFPEGEYLKGEHKITIREDNWDSRKIGAGAAPLKTKYGWLLIYYAVDDKDDTKYKIGAMLLDLKDPAKVLYRTDAPILEPVEWYENAGHKTGVAYPCGVVAIKNRLFIYYGGADTVVCVATANAEEFLQELMGGKKPKLKRVKRLVKKTKK